nr:pre-mrna-processing protein 40a [Quercus suber]
MADESSSTTSRPNNDRPVIVFGGFTLGKQRSVRDDGAIVSQIEWFSIDVPDADADSHCQKQKLNPLSVMEIEKQCYFAALDSSIYCISSHHFRDRVQIFDLTGGDIDGWQPGPPPIVSRVEPHKFVVDGKLYILGGVREVDSPWMEVLDPKIGVWKPLPNPPVEIGYHSRNVVALLLKPKKQILVSSLISKHTPSDPPEFRFFTYNIDDQSWEPLDTPVSVFKLLRGFGFSQRTNTALADGDTLYWVSFDSFARHELVIHAYNLITDEWFEGYLYDPPEFRFFTYNIDDQSWEPLDTPVSVFKLLRGFGFSQSTNTALADGDTLYWVSFDSFARHELVIHAYNLITDEWFEGYLDTRDDIFGKKELLTEHSPHGLLHLGHSKFCLLLQSSFIPNTNKRQRQREQYIEIPYLYCVIIVVSKISNMDPDQQGFKDLNISEPDLQGSLLLYIKAEPFKEQFQPVVPTQQGQTCGPSASQQFQPMVQEFLSNVAMPASPSQPRVPPVTNHVSGLPQNHISALSQIQPTSQMLAPVVLGQPWLSFKHQSAAFATLVLQTGQQPSVIPLTDSAVTVPSLNQHSLSDWQEIRYYYNKRTGESTWDKPPELMAPIEKLHK